MMAVARLMQVRADVRAAVLGARGWMTTEQVAMAAGLRSRSVTARHLEALAGANEIAQVARDSTGTFRDVMGRPAWSKLWGSPALLERIRIVEVFGADHAHPGGNRVIEVEVEIDGERSVVHSTFQGGGLRFWAYAQLPAWERIHGRGATIALDAALTDAWERRRMVEG